MKVHLFVFTAPMPGGPWRRVFHCPLEFDEYIRNWRAGFGMVTFDSPWIARGAL